MKKYHCYKCGIYKEKSEFYKDSSRRIGITSSCKSCQLETISKREKSEYWQDYKKRNWHKLQARWKLRRSVKEGLVKKLPCVKCGDEKSEAHHEDYSKPLEVVWLCKKHHSDEGLPKAPPR